MDSILIRRQLLILDLICTEYKIPRAKRERLKQWVYNGMQTEKEKPERTQKSTTD